MIKNVFRANYVYIANHNQFKLKQIAVCFAFIFQHPDKLRLTH